MSLAATLEPLRAANRAAGRELYRWRVFSADGAPPVSSSGLPVVVQGRFSASDARDMLFIVAAFEARRHAAAVLPELRRLARRSILIGGIESGTWVLARAGLLNGRRATTHWEDLESFAASFPDIDVVDERYVIDRARCTTSGAAPTLDMMLDMLRERHGLALAMEAASIFIYDTKAVAREPQRVVLAGTLRADDPSLAAAIAAMDATIAEPLPMDAIARRAGLSRRNLELRFKAALGMTPHAYYLDLRLAAARRMLEQSRTSVAEAAAAYGFGSASAFARAFRRRYGLNPQAIRPRQRRVNRPELFGDRSS